MENNSIQSINQKIYFIRNHKVMIDHDLANLYDVPTKVLKQAVRRNLNRFPPDFMFQLTFQEVTSLRSQIVTSKLKETRGGSRYLPYAFTEQGVAMLSSVLKSEKAIEVNIEIIRTFVKLREILSENKDLSKKLEALEKKYDAQFKVVFDAIRQLMSPTLPTNRTKIGFKK